MLRIKRRLLLFTVIFFIGGCVYSTVEIVFRQHTHLSMFFAGGICLLLIALADGAMQKSGLLVRSAFCGLLITAVELVFGIVFNVILDLNVWDYSSEPFNLFGQICLPFSLMWVLISIPAILITRLTVTVFFSDGN